MKENVFFIGFMGTGKSTIGKEVARRLNLDFIDTDILIEQQFGMSIPKIFEKHGEDHFRILENQLIMDLTCGCNSIISTGGGAPLYHGNMEIMKKSGLIITLETSPTILWSRLRDCEDRPILQKYNTFEKFDRLYIDRKSIYDKADIIIKTDGKSIDQIVYECIEQILA